MGTTFNIKAARLAFRSITLTNRVTGVSWREKREECPKCQRTRMYVAITAQNVVDRFLTQSLLVLAWAQRVDAS
jgi:hypothetical protein